MILECAADTQKDLPSGPLFVIFCRLYYNDENLLFTNEKD
jgi:hypothetical protein